jgi:N-acetylglucosamine-6-phosphate deacetylase|tara:strand:- start:139 stop:1269 length:1131 start_codon:yes stop_codon:yes gene_type:complete
MFRLYKQKTIFREMTNSNKVSGKIINYNDSYSGEITFDENILNINKIEEINSENYIIPGFVDLHCHGGGGFDTMDGVQAIQKMSSYHLSKGTTSLLATTWTSSFEHTYAALNDFNSLIDMSSNLIGVHLEGPFINPKKLGAQPALAIEPSIDFIEKINEIADIKTITLAPEIKDMKMFIPFLIDKNINVQFGHTLADSKTCEKYMSSNEVSFTHLYNAMSDNNHRNPGVLSAALNKGKFAEIICDLNHVSEEAILIAKKCIPDLYAITDSIAASGMKDGSYTFANVEIEKKNNKVCLNGTSTLAGSVVNMHDTFLNLLKMKISIQDAVRMTSYSAAKFLKKDDIGVIDDGKKANFLILDHDFNIKSIYLNGKLING